MKKAIPIVVLSAAAVFVLAWLILYRPDPGPLPTAELEPVFSFGGLDVAEEAVLNSPSDMVLDEQGDLLVSDFLDNSILVFNGRGDLQRKFGRPGSGPGEMKGPSLLGLGERSIQVLESQANRIQFFSLQGEFQRIEPLKVVLGMTAPLFGLAGDIFLPSGGFRTEDLISHYASDGQKLRSIGRIEGDSFEMYEMLKIRDALIDGTVPDALRNQILLLQTEDRRLFAFFQGLPLIKIFSSEGGLEKAVELDIPEFPDIIETCSLKNLEERQKGSPSFWGLRFWRDGLVTEKGQILMLLSYPERMILYRFDRDGRVVKRYLGVEDNIQMIAARGSTLWAFGVDTQIFYRFQVE